VYANGNKFTGKFKNNLEHGIGAFFNKKNGTEVQKEYREGKHWSWSNKQQNEEIVNPILHFKTDK